MIRKLGFGTLFDSVPVYIESALTLHVAGNWTYSLRVKYVALQYFYSQGLVKENIISTYCVKIEEHNSLASAPLILGSTTTVVSSS